MVLLAAFAFVAVYMRDVGSQGRAARSWRRFGDEARTILRAGATYGWRKPAVRWLFFASAAQGVFFIFGFYSWQRYFLDLLARELVWVNGLVTAAFALADLGQRVREAGDA